MIINSADVKKSDPLYYVKFGSAFWLTTIFSTTIHELGHLIAARMCNLPVYSFHVGAETNPYFKTKGMWKKTFRFNPSNPIDVQFNPLNPFIGCIAHGSTKSPWKIIAIAGSGPLLQIIATAIPYYLSNKHIQKAKKRGDDYNPFLFGVYLACAVGILGAFLNLVPVGEGTDGFQMVKELKAIADSSQL